MKIVYLIAVVFCCLFSNSQTYQWAKGIGGPVNGSGSIPANAGFCVTTDAAGSVYVTGSFQGISIDFNPGLGPVTLSSGNVNVGDIFFAKYTAAGNCTWAKGIIGSSGIGRSIALDAGGNVYITGQFQGTNIDFDPGAGVANLSSSGVNDIFFAKYDAGGNYLWARSIGGSTQDYGTSISIDPSGNVYITGYFQSALADFDPGPGVANLSCVGPAGTADLFFAKYDTNGNYLWAKAVGSTGGNDLALSISTDATGNSYITGSFAGISVDFDPGPGTAVLSAGASTTTAVYFAKYDASGNYLWAKTISGSSPSIGHSISVDAAGNAWITGSFTGSSVDFDPGPGVATLTTGALGGAMFFGKYNANGNYLWAKAIEGAGAGSIARNVSGKVYLTGQFASVVDFDPGPGTATLSASGIDLYFAKYDAAGNYIWAKSIPTSSSGDQGRSIAVDGSDNVYITGSFNGNNTDFDPGPGTATISTFGYSYMHLAKYAFCSTQLINPQAVCAGGSYAVNGHTYTASGIYNDTLYTAFGCDSVVVTQMTVSAQQPTLTVSGSSLVCTGSSYTLSAGGAVTYTWSNGPQTPTVVITPTNTTPYVVSGTDASGCKGTDTVKVLLTPTLGIIAKPAICKGEQIIMTASGANSYTWNSGAQTPSISATLTTTTLYTVTASFTNSPCKNQQTFTINVMPCLSVNSMVPEELKASVYPNPAKTELFYTVNRSGIHWYMITDLNGKVWAEGEQRSSKVRIDLSSYPPGIYNLTIRMGKNVGSTRFLIEKTE